MIGIQYGWDDGEKTVIRVYVGDYWDWDDFNVAMVGVAEMMHEVTHQVDVTTIMRPNTALPEGNASYHIKNAIASMPTNAGIHVMVGGNMLINRTVRMMSNTYTCMIGRFFQTDKLGEAYRIIARNRPEVYETFEMAV